MQSRNEERKNEALLLLFFFVLLITRNAWVSDDAFITFRSIENFLAGYGMGYNPYVRVQSFTHPLWMLILSFLYFLEQLFAPYSQNALYYVTIIFSIICSLLAIFLLSTKIARPSILSVTLAVLILSLSSAFVDYSTSGLENPLTHLLLALFILVYIAKSQNIFWMAFIAAMITLNRMDALLLVAPALIYAWWSLEQRPVAFFQIVLGFLPVLLWEMFSLFYFGFPFPNTAYAKLNTGISSILFIQQGSDYFLNSINWDPLTLFAIVFAAVGLYANRNRRLIALYMGVVLYLAYILKIGGDFMSGRFFTAPLYVSVAVISMVVDSRRIMLLGFGIIILLGAFSVRSPLQGSNVSAYYPKLSIVDKNDIDDERLYYIGYNFVENGFLDAPVYSHFAGKNWIFYEYKRAAVIDQLGKDGYAVGPNVYVTDCYALSDPLLARLPVVGKWRIGHFYRQLPDGYYETLETGENKIVDINLALYYSKLQIITKGRLRDLNRLVEIWKFNTGQYDHLLEKYRSQGLGSCY